MKSLSASRIELDLTFGLWFADPQGGKILDFRVSVES